MGTLDSAGTIQSERDDVISWRHTQLLRSGFPPDIATSIARDDRYDLHRLVELVDRGCPPELARRILAPLGEDEAE